MVVRTDKQLGDDFSQSKSWKSDGTALYDFIQEVEVDGKIQRIVSSQSGHERNHLFLNRPDGAMEDVSLYSGVDSIADGRANAFWDFDHDGLRDIAVVNANEPFLELFHNQLKPYQDHAFVAIRLVGGNTADRASTEFSNRDGIGAIVTVQTDEQRLVRELRAGEGFAGQNTKILLVGIGQSSEPSIQVRWPSGIERDYGAVPTGKLITCYEDLNATLDRTGRQVAEYPAGDFQVEPQSFADRAVFQPIANAGDADTRLHVYVSMATWCANCKKAQPQVQRLVDRFGDQVRFWGIPIDPEDTPDMLAEYRKKYSPAYQLQLEMPADRIKQMEQIVTGLSGQGGLPSSVITTTDGHVIAAIGGVPTVSELARWLEQAPEPATTAAPSQTSGSN